MRKTDFLELLTTTQKALVVFTPNPEILLAAKEKPGFSDTLNQADYLTPDGIGLYAGFQMVEDTSPRWAKILKWPWYGAQLFFNRKALYERYGDRICGSDTTKILLEDANEKGLGVTIVDKFQAPGDAWDNLKIERQKLYVPMLQEKYPNARFHLYIWKEEEVEGNIQAINESGDRYLFSSQGLFAQEKTIFGIMPKLTTIKVAMGIGGSFDMILGFKKRSPKIFTKLGIEWLWRLLIDSNKKRMLKRIWRAIFVFLWEVSKV